MAELGRVVVDIRSDGEGFFGGWIYTDCAQVKQLACQELVRRGRWTPLHVAAASGHTDAAESLLAKGADVNAMEIADDTPLHVAAASGNTVVFLPTALRCGTRTLFSFQGTRDLFS